MSKNVFKHSGDLGDIIYALPAIQALGGGHLVIGKGKKGKIREPMTQQKIVSLTNLLIQQSYITDVSWMRAGVRITHDFDLFRPLMVMTKNIVDAQLKLFGLPSSERDKPWLYVFPEKKVRVIFARSARYHNPNFPWKEVYAAFSSEAAFVGTEAEHRVFCNEFGFIYRLETPNLRSLAAVISGAELLVANQSCPLAIGFGVGANIVVEECPYARDCHIERPNVSFNKLPLQCLHRLQD